MIFEPAPSPDYVFDAAAADRAVRFIERFCRHYEGRRFAGKPFVLLDWQTKLVRTIFGWKHAVGERAGLRRFHEVYLLTAKGSGKTPLLAAIGLYMLLADGEPAAQVISCATDVPQARLSFDAGQKYIAADPHLAGVCECVHTETRGPANASWVPISGTAEGRHGFRPHCILFDEAHEWPNGLLYDNLTANSPKRDQYLNIVATNAGPNRSCFAWQLHERALAVLQRKPEASPTLLPAIFEADESLPWDGEEAASQANPSLGKIIPFASLAPQIQKARESAEAKGKYCRLFLSQWSKLGGGRWLDLEQVDRAMATPFNASARVSDPLYVGVDLSQGDDLCALVYLWPTPERWYAASQFWITRDRAAAYERQAGIPYMAWAKAGHITLLDEITVTPAVQQRLAAELLARTRGHTLKAVCYDRYNAGHFVAALDAAGVTCVPIAQGYSLSPGCREIERRLKDDSIRIASNHVMRFCAENCEITADSRANIWPVKPNAKDKYAGKRVAKIDGLVSLVTAAVEARKFDFPKAQPSWKDLVYIP